MNVEMQKVRIFGKYQKMPEMKNPDAVIMATPVR